MVLREPWISNCNETDVIARIQELVPPGAREPQEPAVLAKLTVLTEALIQAYGRDRLELDPFGEARQRRLFLDHSLVSRQLEHKRVLVTGGAGLVGTHLVAALSRFSVQSIVALDNLQHWTWAKPTVPLEPGVPLKRIVADVRDAGSLERIFADERPDVVFHLAAQRLPGLAELQVRDTVATNVLGTQHVLDLCEAFGVEKCLFASTGKASRYFTSEIYAGTKKLSEWQFAERAARTGLVCGMVRFTHIIENSPVGAEIDKKIQCGIVSHHAPHRYMQVQNVHEAVHLLLNAAVLARPGGLRFLVVKDLGWPVDVLELALHRIVRSGKAIPLYFRGLPAGYEEHTFYGQFDARGDAYINPLLNVLESDGTESDPSDEIFIGQLRLPQPDLLLADMARLEAAVLGDNVRHDQLKRWCTEAVRRTAASLFESVDPALVLNILKWGIDPTCLEREEVAVSAHRDIVELLLGTLYGRLTPDVLKRADHRVPSMDTMANVLEELPGAEKHVAYLRQFARLEDHANAWTEFASEPLPAPAPPTHALNGHMHASVSAPNAWPG